jgi:small GTP-binding protein
MPENEIKKKVCMVGSFAVGKTSLVRRYIEGIYDERYFATVEVKVDKKKVMVDSQPLTLMLWDMAGEDDLAQLRKSHLRGAAGFILVADGSRARTLDIAIDLQQRITYETGPVPFILALNKADLTRQWEIRDPAIEPLRSKGWTYFFTSAKNGRCVEEMFLSLAKKMLKPKE